MFDVSATWLRRVNMVAFNGFWYMLLLVAGGVLPQWLNWLVLAYCLVHWLITPYGRLERTLITLTLSLGLFAEFAFQYFHVLSYSDQGVIYHLPLWILMMWLNFACSLAHAWWPWLRKWWAGLLVGALATTFPYLGAQKTGILTVHLPYVLAIFWLLYGCFISYALNVMFRNYEREQTSDANLPRV